MSLINNVGVNVFGCLFCLTFVFIGWAQGNYWAMLAQAALLAVNFALLQINLARLRKARRGQ